MTEPIRRVGVIGAGVMGSGIAAHFANAGVEVVLLDIVPPNLTDEERKSKANRDRFAAGALQATIKAKPALFYHKNNASLITTGNLEDDLDQLADVDLVVEAIIENLKIKQSLFEKLEKVCKEESVALQKIAEEKLEMVREMAELREEFEQKFGLQV